MDFAGDSVTEAVRNTLADVQTPALRWLIEYWNAKRGARSWPSRADIDPLELRPVLGHVVILDVLPPREEGGDPAFRYRLFGSNFVQWFGFDMTGKTIDEWPAPEYRDYLNRSYAEVVAAARPFRRYRRLIKDGRPLNYESLMLPLGTEGRIDQVIAAQFFEG